METKTHWKNNFDYNYLGSYSLQEGEEKTLTIKEIKKGEVYNTSTKQKEEKMILHFVENEKPMVLNPTNHSRIESLYATPYIEEWINKKIIIVNEKGKWFGKVQDALRVKMQKPTERSFAKEEKQLKDCKTLEGLKEVFLKFDTDAKNKLNNLKNELKNKL